MPTARKPSPLVGNPLVLFDRWGASTWNERQRSLAGLQLITVGDGGARPHPSRVVGEFHMQLRPTCGSLSAGFTPRTMLFARVMAALATKTAKCA